MTATGTTWRKLAIVAGGGALPIALADACLAAGRPIFVLGLEGFADGRIAAYPHGWAGIGEIGKLIAAMEREGCDAVTFAGNVVRPDFKSVKVDWRGAALLPAALAAARQGDDALLRVILGAFEKAGLTIIGAEAAAEALRPAAGAIGQRVDGPEHHADIAKAFVIAQVMGAHDIGQGAVVCDGLVLAVEAQEGTDAMLARVAELPEVLRGTAARRRGVLAKVAKPIQERRVDLPTIGLATVERAAAAGLAGVAIEAGGALVMDRGAVAEAADALGLFVVAWPPGAIPRPPIRPIEGEKP